MQFLYFYGFFKKKYETFSHSRKITFICKKFFVTICNTGGKKTDFFFYGVLYNSFENVKLLYCDRLFFAILNYICSFSFILQVSSRNVIYSFIYTLVFLYVRRRGKRLKNFQFTETFQNSIYPCFCPFLHY